MLGVESTWLSTLKKHRYCRPVPLQVGQTIFLLPPQVLQVLPLTLPLPLQTGQRIVFAPWHVAHVAIVCSFL
jgi:hypothetical protein